MGRGLAAREIPLRSSWIDDGGEGVGTRGDGFLRESLQELIVLRRAETLFLPVLAQ